MPGPGDNCATAKPKVVAAYGILSNMAVADGSVYVATRDPAGRSRSHGPGTRRCRTEPRGLQAVEVGMVVVPDDQDGLADDAGALDGPPVAAVAGVCAVVAEDVELAGRDAVGMLAACDRRA